MLINPRQYQVEAVQSIYDFFSTHNEGHPIIAMPTGTGKSVVIAMFLEGIFNQWMNQRVMVLTHVKELIQQNYMKLITLWPTAPAGIYSSGLNRRDTQQRIIFAGIASVAKRAHEFQVPDLVIIDEAHLVSPSDETMYRTFLNAMWARNPDMRVIGLTATKWRLGHGDITNGEDSLFTHTCFDITGMSAFNRLIAEGYLAPLVPMKASFMVNLDGVHMRGGEFVQGEMETAFNRDEITERALRQAIDCCEDRKSWLIFASGVQHAIDVCSLLNSMGVECGVVHSKMSPTERDKNIEGFKSGKLRALVNNNVLTTGFDHPPIDLIICLRATASSVLWVQMLGRGTRPYPGKENCLVLDFAGNARRLGPINDPVVPRPKGKGGGEAPVKECPQCGCHVHASLRICNAVKMDGTACNFEFPLESKLKQEAATEQLIKGDLPIVERFHIDRIEVQLHKKISKPDAVRVIYYVNNGLQAFNEFVCLEHDGYAAKRARDWVRARMPSKTLPIPESTQRLLEYAHNLKVPSDIKVWINKKYPEIMGFEWNENDIEVDVAGGNLISAGYADRWKKTMNSELPDEDDIPF